MLGKTKGTMPRWRLVAVMLVLFSLALSGCFQIRGFNIKPKQLGPGGQAAVALNLFKHSTAGELIGHAFLLIGIRDLDFAAVSQFDMKRNHGGRYPRVKNNPLRTVLLTGSNCSVSGVTASSIEASFDEWGAWHTVAKVDPSASELNKVFRVRVKFDRAAGTDDDLFGDVVVFSGVWTDGNDDGVVTAGEVICTGAIGFSIPFRS